MEFIYKNFIQTTTSIVVDSNTSTVAFLLNRDRTFQYSSDGFNNDTTTTTMRINFSETTTVSRIALLSHNLEGFTIYYNGATANTFSMSTTSDTTTSDYSGNTDTNKYLTVTPVDCTSVSIDMKTTISANAEKAIGHLVISDLLLDFERLPAAGNYNPMLEPRDVVHTLSNGGQRKQTLDENWRVNISYRHITETFRNSLKTVFDLHSEFMFVPFGTATGWSDEIIFPSIWTGPFNFYRYSDNAVDSGFSGSISLRETPR
jgi:hypothetical protein